MNESLKQAITYLLEGEESHQKQVKNMEKKEMRASKYQRKSNPTSNTEYATSRSPNAAAVVTKNHPTTSLLLVSLAEERIEDFFQYLNTEVSQASSLGGFARANDEACVIWL